MIAPAKNRGAVELMQGVLADTQSVATPEPPRNNRTALVARILRRLPDASVPIRPSYAVLLRAAQREART